MQKVTRKIIEIEESLCDGCGLCIPACPEQAIELVETSDGLKAQIVKELFCDGLGACLGDCPTGALTINEREADPYDDQATVEHIKKNAPEMLQEHLQHIQKHAGEIGIEQKSDVPEFAGCPSSRTMQWSDTAKSPDDSNRKVRFQSELRQWPIQLHLVPPFAPFFKDAKLAVVADCVPFTYANFHQDFLKDKAIVVGCPKLDDAQAYVEKISQIIKFGQPVSLEVVYMEVPCCSGLVNIVGQAMERSGKELHLTETIINIRSEE
ncbi:4Fe-4S ferredoxin [candidate division LCP-89 bacterium B3_LCP]|uniref:4Fe-4S ferredoxin n=1 Tax=candidate division LCP-89 bacterium B3_LCP TaxID=2012998 RepID=A0A532V3D6_UNCL8|nr:MAG: 4Fe-4S ferredoxin [candidate division LCP-89 bacterium B3_LCP]